MGSPELHPDGGWYDLHMAASPRLQNQVERAVREALIASIRDDRSLTIDRIIALRKEYPEVGTISVAELLDGAPSGARRTARAGATRSGRKSQAVHAKAVDTRSATGRDAYDQHVLSIVKEGKGTKVSAQDIRKMAGGTPEQARRALNRLIEAGKIDYTGKARATRYFSK